MRPGEDLEDIQIYFREIASARESVENPLKEYYRGALDVQTKRTVSGSTYTIPQNVCAGYLRKEDLPTVQSIREEEETRAAEAKPRSEDEMKAALLAKFGSKYKK